MGSGKAHWTIGRGSAAGKILFEMEGVAPEVAQEAMRLASNKLPLKTKFVMRPGAEKVVAGQVGMQLLAASLCSSGPIEGFCRAGRGEQRTARS